MSTESYYQAIRRHRGARYERSLRHKMSLIYRGVDFSGKTVLDIGGGIGVHSLYASARGAASATIIEPEGDGGHNTMISTFHELRDAMGISNVELLRTTIQDFDQSEAFDIVLIQDAINHFDEPACITLRTSEESRKAYDAIFRSIAAAVKPGGLLIMTDCSSRNLYPTLGLRNPVDPGIEWNKHQPPSVWAALAKPHGLQLDSLRWTSPSRFGAVGQALFGNALAAWFFTSHFAATFRKRGSAEAAHH